MKNRFLTFTLIALLVFSALSALFWFAGETRAAVNADLPGFRNLAGLSSPTIAAVQPNSGLNDVETSIVIQGSGFSATITGTQVLTVPQVYLGEAELPEVIWGNTTTLSATVPWKLPAQVYPLTVVNPDGGSATLQNAFTVIDNLPMLDSIEPNTAPNDIDTQVVIHGEKIGAVISGTQVITPPTVYLGDEQLPPVTWVDSTTLNAAVPWGLAPQIYDLTVVNPSGISATLTNTFTVTEGLGEFRTGGPYGGMSTKLKLNPADPETVYALMYGAGLFISEDGAENWAPIHDHDWPLQLDFDAQDSNILYFGADSNDLYRSLDNGATWERISEDFHTQNGCFQTYPVAHPSQTGHVYFGMGSCGGINLEAGEGGVFYSTDFGDTWSTHNNGLSDLDVQTLAIHPNYPTTLLAGTFDGNLFYSMDGSDNWVWSTQLTGTISRLYFNPYESLEAWAITRSDAEGRGYLYRSTNLMDWDLLSIDPQPMGPAQAQIDFSPGTVWLATVSVYKSTDDGTTWDPVNSPAWSAVALAVSPDDPQTIYTGTDFGVEKSTDGGQTWDEVTDGLAAMVPNSLAISPTDPDTVYVKTHQGIYVSHNGGYEWQYLDYGIGGFNGRQSLAVDRFDDTRIYLNAQCEDEFCIEISPNGGASWDLVTSALPSAYAGWSCSSFAIVPSPHTPGRVLVGASLNPPGGGDDAGIFFRSDDYGASWSYIEPSQPLKHISEIAYDAFNPNLIYAATSETGFWRSTDGGDTWASVPVDGESIVSVAAIAVHPNVPNKVYIRSYSTVAGPNPEPELWFSENAGASWQPMGYVFTGVDLLMAPPVPDQFLYTLYTGCNLGLCRSFNDGAVWNFIEGMPRPEILSTASDGERSIVYLGTPGGLIYAAGGQVTYINDALPGRGNLGGGGVYRLTMALPDHWIYLPLIIR